LRNSGIEVSGIRNWECGRRNSGIEEFKIENVELQDSDDEEFGRLAFSISKIYLSQELQLLQIKYK
jgi:hypothetical protein